MRPQCQQHARKDFVCNPDFITVTRDMTKKQAKTNAKMLKKSVFKSAGEMAIA
jgi:hypothetical protein